MSEYNNIYKSRTGKDLLEVEATNLVTNEILVLTMSSKGEDAHYSYKIKRLDSDLTPIDDIIYGLAKALCDINEYAQDPLDIQGILDILMYKIEVGEDY